MEAIEARFAGRQHFLSERLPRPMQPDVQGIGENTDAMSRLLLRLTLDIHLHKELRLSRPEPCDVLTEMWAGLGFVLLNFRCDQPIRQVLRFAQIFSSPHEAAPVICYDRTKDAEQPTLHAPHFAQLRGTNESTYRKILQDIVRGLDIALQSAKNQWAKLNLHRRESCTHNDTRIAVGTLLLLENAAVHVIAPNERRSRQNAQPRLAVDISNLPPQVSMKGRPEALGRIQTTLRYLLHCDKVSQPWSGMPPPEPARVLRRLAALTKLLGRQFLAAWLEPNPQAEAEAEASGSGGFKGRTISVRVV